MFLRSMNLWRLRQRPGKSIRLDWLGLTEFFCSDLLRARSKAFLECPTTVYISLRKFILFLQKNFRPGYAMSTNDGSGC